MVIFLLVFRKGKNKGSFENDSKFLLFDSNRQAESFGLAKKKKERKFEDETNFLLFDLRDVNKREEGKKKKKTNLT